MEAEYFSPTFSSIGEILPRHKFVVPKYQRSYAWSTDELDELFLDIKNAIRENKASYFIGSIVVTDKGNNKVELVDGQQRLASISILIAAMRDYFISISDERRANKLASYLYEESFRADFKEFHLSLNYEDNDYFRNTILLPPIERAGEKTKITLTHSNKLLLEAWNHALKFVNNLKQDPDPVKTLGDWEEYINYKLKVIFVKVSDEANAFTIFETLNDRGLDLAISDLLKNYLLAQVGERTDEMLNTWQKMIHNIEPIGNDSLVVTYIRHFWSTRNGLTREKDLYRKIRLATVGELAAFRLVNELEEWSYYYQALFNSDAELWHTIGEDADKYIQELLEIEVEQNRPLILAILVKFDDKYKLNALKLIVSAAVRTKVSRLLGSSSLENGYSETAKKIFNNEIKTLDGLVKYMNTFVPNDDNFKKDFETLKVAKSSQARYYLSILEQNSRDEETMSRNRTQKVNLEHILPRKPTASWDNFSDEERKDYLNRLGNLTLLSSIANSTKGNDSFCEKKKSYKISHINITKAISSYKYWSPKTIDRRQKELAELAVKAWPFRL